MASSIATVKVFQKNLLATVGALSLAASTALLAQPVQAQAAVAKNIDIPAQSLASSLNQIGRQTSSEIIFLSSTVQGRRAPAVHGNFTAEQAIRLAIEGTALAARQTPQGAYVIDRAPSSGESGAGSAAAESGDAEIIVTAQRREERLTDVPLSITAASAAELTRAGVTNVRQIVSITPGVTMQSTGPWLQPAVRGVSSQSTIPGSEQNVALYVDGVYQPTAVANTSDLPDVERIEVLKGPQGTLFGRNATGGAIQIITRDPSFSTTGNLTASYGRFRDVTLQGYISTPLSDKVAVGVTGSYTSTDGWLKDLLNDRRHTGKITSELVRAKLLFRPNENLKVLLTGFYRHRTDNNINRDNALNGNTVAVSLGITPVAVKPFDVSTDFTKSNVFTRSYGVTLRAELATRIGTFISTSSYLNDAVLLYNDGDQSPVDILRFELREPHKTWQQEFLFNFEKIGHLRLTAGAYYYDHKTGYRDPVLTVYLGGQPFQKIAVLLTSRSYAGFAQGTYDLTDSFSIIGGVRYSYEKRTINRNYDTTPIRGSTSFNSVTPRASLVYALTPSSNVYFTYSRGFKSGQFDTENGSIVDPEKLSAYEIGYKASSHGFSFESAAFYYDYKDVQQAFLRPATGTGGLENAGGARIYGVEASVRARVTPEFGVSAQASYLNAKFRQFLDASITVPIIGANGKPTGGNNGVSANLSGFPMPRVPKFSGSIAATYEKEFSSGKLEISGTIYYSGSYGMENSNRIRQPSYANVNLNINWTIKDTGLKIGVYGNNLANEKIFTSSILNTFGDYVAYQEPVNYGVRASYSF